jgi:hypothetical protein
MAARGTRNMDAGEEKIPDEPLVERLRATHQSPRPHYRRLDYAGCARFPAPVIFLKDSLRLLYHTAIFHHE